eukprot:CAMPEP_0119387468 /NCGR_PEP_ID=MMETSP1334-20130426/100799_1 /TAXON_ID=127549 /ORGANISM="Calcidiscus leptoporus, Strain RCC1130" /LENGTH=150 /DNA_ID=CAMNT_0007409217 /DNA_START=369 /DNA_END=822 /DNA_ORIENTATION=-
MRLTELHAPHTRRSGGLREQQALELIVRLVEVVVDDHRFEEAAPIEVRHLALGVLEAHLNLVLCLGASAAQPPSSASSDGGEMKMKRAFRPVCFTSSAPCTSMSSKHVFPASETACTAAMDVPYMFLWTCAYSMNSPRAIAFSMSGLATK